MGKLDGASLEVLRQSAAAGELALPVRGTCMAPGVEDGATVEIRTAGRYLPGDVVAFSSADGGVRLARVLGYWPRAGRVSLLTAGDRHRRLDEPVAPERLLGRVSGGQCASEMIDVPLSRRLWALARLGPLAVAALGRRVTGRGARRASS